jgi:hypothetical protein
MSGTIMKKFASFVLLMVFGLGIFAPAALASPPENRAIGENQREAKRAAKQQKKYAKKQSKRQRKMMKGIQKNQKRAAKRRH